MRKRGRNYRVLKSKRGQFYLIAAVVIVIILIGLAAVTNYVLTKPEQVRFYDLSEELDLESAKVIEHGIYQTDKEVEEVIEDFTDNYWQYAQSSISKVVFVYGSTSEVTALVYLYDESGDVGLEIGGSSPSLEFKESHKFKFKETSISGDQVTIKIGDDEHVMDLSEGENFYFVVEEEAENEKYVAQK